MSNFQGTWQYARQTAQGTAVVRDMATITVTDDENGNPYTVKFELADPNSPSLELPVDSENTACDLSFTKEGIKGRLVILSAATPALLIGSINQPAFLPSGGKQGSGEDDNTDVFIAVKGG